MTDGDRIASRRDVGQHGDGCHLQVPGKEEGRFRAIGSQHRGQQLLMLAMPTGRRLGARGVVRVEVALAELRETHDRATSASAHPTDENFVEVLVRSVPGGQVVRLACGQHPRQGGSRIVGLLGRETACGQPDAETFEGDP
jgi:hypothetical protein